MGAGSVVRAADVGQGERGARCGEKQEDVTRPGRLAVGSDFEARGRRFGGGEPHAGELLVTCPRDSSRATVPGRGRALGEEMVCASRANSCGRLSACDVAAVLGQPDSIRSASIAICPQGARPASRSTCQSTGAASAGQESRQVVAAPKFDAAERDRRADQDTARWSR
jgi:hypothetical protein